MGRPPIGKTAMSGAERVRRYREKHGVKPAAKPAAAATSELALVKKVEAEATRLRAELAKRDVRIAELEEAIAIIKAAVARKAAR